jgi:hypothetical protein
MEAYKERRKRECFPPSNLCFLFCVCVCCNHAAVSMLFFSGASDAAVYYQSPSSQPCKALLLTAAAADFYTNFALAGKQWLLLGVS